jgi:hypothetical protein
MFAVWKGIQVSKEKKYCIVYHTLFSYVTSQVKNIIEHTQVKIKEKVQRRCKYCHMSFVGDNLESAWRAFQGQKRGVDLVLFSYQ